MSNPNLRSALEEEIQSAVSNVACDLDCNFFEVVVKVKVEDGWTQADILSLDED